MTNSFISSEIADLRRATRDIVALSALPSIWVNQTPSQVVCGLAETLVRCLSLQFAYIQVVGAGADADAAYAKRGFITQEALAAISSPLRERVSASRTATTTMSDPFGAGQVHVYAVPIGPSAKAGVVIVGSARTPFPTEAERLVLNVATNQVNVTVAHKWAQERADKLLERAEEGERQLRVARDVSERERRMLESIFDSSPTFIAVLRGPDFVFERINARYLELVGQRAAVGRKLAEALPEVQHQGFPQILSEVLTTGKTFVASEMPVDLLRQPGAALEKRYVDLVYQRIRDETGEDLIFTHGVDVTENVIARHNIESAKDEAERANALKSSFLANMSHEIRTPLGVLIGFTDLVLDPELTAEDRSQYASVLKRNGEQLSAIINDILDLSKVEAGFLKIDPKVFSVATLLDEVRSDFATRAAEKGLSLVVTLGDHSNLIVSDPVRLKQILVNLISNAVKFTDHGRIDISSSQSDDVVTFKVTDTGLGIHEQDRQKLFKPFSQADTSSSRRFGGTGLGLALSKRLAHLLGGELTLAASEPGRGSTFALTVRVGQSKSVSAKAQVAASPALQPEKPEAPILLNGLRVLLVEDAPDNRQLISRVLYKSGALVEMAENGLAGVEMALKGRFDVVIMDVQMPVMDGYTATQRLREQGYRQPIIALTAHAMSEVRERCLDVGYTDYLPKPVKFRDLLEKVATHSRRGPM